MTAKALTQVDATGDVTTSVPAVLHSVLLTAGSDAATLVVRDGDGGSTLLTLKAAANTSVQWRARRGVHVGTGIHIHATFTGTAPVASFEYD